VTGWVDKLAEYAIKQGGVPALVGLSLLASAIAIVAISHWIAQRYREGYRDRLEDLRSQIDSRDGLLDQLEDALERHSRQIDDLQKSVGTLKAENEELRRANRRARDANVSLLQHTNALREQNMVLHRLVSRLSDEVGSVPPDVSQELEKIEVPDGPPISEEEIERIEYHRENGHG